MNERASLDRDVRSLAEHLRHAPPWVIVAVNRRRAELRLAPVPVLPRLDELLPSAASVHVATARGLRAKADAALARLRGGKVGGGGKLPFHAGPLVPSARTSGVFSKGAMP